MACTNCNNNPESLNRQWRSPLGIRFINDPGSPGVSPHRRLATVDMVARYLNCIPRTVRNHVSRGLYPGYKIPGTRGIRIDLNDVDRAMKPIPAVIPRETKQPYRGNIIALDTPQTVLPELVTPTPGTDA